MAMTRPSPIVETENGELVARRGISREVIEELRHRGTDLAESTIRTHVASRMCASAPDNHGTMYADFERVDHGEYRWRK